MPVADDPILIPAGAASQSPSWHDYASDPIIIPNAADSYDVIAERLGRTAATNENLPGIRSVLESEPWGVRQAHQGVYTAALGLMGTAAMATGGTDSPEANQQFEAIDQINAIGRTIGPQDIVSRNLPNVADSLTSMYLAGGPARLLGAGRIGTTAVLGGSYAAKEHGSAGVEGRRAGLHGEALDAYRRDQAIAEAVPMTAMSLIGGGRFAGLERGVIGGAASQAGRPGMWQFLKQFGKDLTYEEFEELATELWHMERKVGHNVDPDALKPERLKEAFKDVTASTAMMMGGANVRSGIDATAKTATDFRQSREPFLVASRLYLSNPEAARQIAELDAPSRSAFEAAGVDFVPNKATRAEVANTLRGMLAQTAAIGQIDPTLQRPQPATTSADQPATESPPQAPIPPPTAPPADSGIQPSPVPTSPAAPSVAQDASQPQTGSLPVQPAEASPATQQAASPTAQLIAFSARARQVDPATVAGEMGMDLSDWHAIAPEVYGLMGGQPAIPETLTRPQTAQPSSPAPPAVQPPTPIEQPPPAAIPPAPLPIGRRPAPVPAVPNSGNSAAEQVPLTPPLPIGRVQPQPAPDFQLESAPAGRITPEQPAPEPIPSTKGRQQSLTPGAEGLPGQQHLIPPEQFTADANQRAIERAKAERSVPIGRVEPAPTQQRPPASTTPGIRLSSGETGTTRTGRQTTPFPKVDLSTDRKAANTFKRIDKWLHENAIEEAKSRGDEFAQRSFETENPAKMPQGTRDALNDYLFGDEAPAPVPPPITRPLIGRAEPTVEEFGKGGRKKGLKRTGATKEAKAAKLAEQRDLQDQEIEKHVDDGITADDIRQEIPNALKLATEEWNRTEQAMSKVRKSTGLTSQRVSQIENAGGDYASVPGFDATVDELIDSYPELGLDREWPTRNADKIWALLKEGKKPKPTEYDPDVVRLAAQMIVPRSANEMAANPLEEGDASFDPSQFEETEAERAQREAWEAQPDVDTAGFGLGGGRRKGERVRPDNIPAVIRAPDAQEARLQAAMGQRRPSLMDRLRETIGHVKGVLRAQEHLPNTPEFAAANEFHRLLKAAPQMARDEAIRRTAAILDPLGPKQKQLFERLAVMENLATAVEAGQPLRFGFESPDAVNEYRDRLREVASQVPEVQKAIETRKKIVRELVNKLVEYKLLPESTAGNTETYYHQQVHLYAVANSQRSGARPGKVKRSFQKNRVLGDELTDEEMDYNTNYVEAEVSWMSDALHEIEKERLFRDLMAKYDIKPRLKDTARRQNFVAVVGGQQNANRIDQILGDLAESRASEDAQDSAERERRKMLIEELLEIDPTHPYRREIAKMASWFRRAHGMDEGGEFEGDESDGEFWERVKSAANDGDIPALSLLKAISEREQFIQDTLGKDYATWETLAKQQPNMEVFQPEPGNAYYQAFTIPDRLVAQLQADAIASAQLSKEDLRQVLAVAGPKRQFVVPTELAKQLQSAQQVEAVHGLAKISDELMKSWKVYTLLNPKRAAAYNLRNVTGDIDPVVASDPSLLSHTAKAMRDLKAYHAGDLHLLPEVRAARDLGVIGSGFVAEEVPDIGDLAVFQRFAQPTPIGRKNPIKSYFNTVKELSQYREDVMRYAAFLGYRQQLKNGTLKHYGGAKKAVVDQLVRDMGIDVAAAHLSRNLLGDYGNISVAGNWIRRRLLPFWSFQEINLKRVPRLVINAWESGGTMRAGGTLTAAAGRAILTSRIAWMYAALWVWNNLWRRDEEEELTGYDRAQPHVNLGRNPDGSIRVFRRVGALGDFLEWFGVNEAMSMWPKYRNGQVSAGDIIKEMSLAAPEKVINSTRPDLKGVVEISTGKSLFPEPFRPRSQERGESASAALGLQDEYRWAKGMILQDGTAPRPHYWQRTLMGVVDPRQSALSEMYDLRNDYLKRKGQPQSGDYPVSRYKPARDAAAAEDYDSFVAWKRKFVEERGDKAQENFRQWLQRMDPISSRLSDDDEADFEKNFLTNEQRARLVVARNYAGELRDLLVSWWDADEKSNDLTERVRQDDAARIGRATNRLEAARKTVATPPRPRMSTESWAEYQARLIRHDREHRKAQDLIDKAGR